ncbi:tRNA epoxyqueuosine(34) reductase QueG [Hyphomicrobium sp.]|uniref:tRNA epoxyqueuosine(34) reductase QueG n=1 Tax=Hyphomicrobium sp. TaxID=82 RepID=UPI002E378C5B|nr:tRNA epoxyqueuosine(34) reductase QueG [Hyphomicrobium sp.]HEX2841491.1 tRNA epoxyqueuosine(34) reductase QueG [Hyphomicrobium sp.]
MSIETSEPTGDTRSRAAIKNALGEQARALGFQTMRITRPDTIQKAGDRLLTFLADGRHGTMEWMEANADRRRDPRQLWSEARSVVMLAMSYAPETDPMEALARPLEGIVSAYAKRADYHDVMKVKLKQLATDLERETGDPVKVFVDTAPLMEKPLAQAAGIGWQGKHTNLVSRDDGSWLFLGAILTATELDPDPPERDHCGRCSRCLDACPTKAFPAPYQLDARRCIAYLTIEHKGHIAEEFRAPIGNRIFGCDDCLAVCPWNKFARSAHETRLHVRAELDNPPLADLLPLDDSAFRARFRGTPVKRTGRDRFVRNCLIAAGNSADRALLPFVAPLLSDPSALVRAMAVWAFRRLADPDAIGTARAEHYGCEQDEAVKKEWDAGTTT